MCYIEYSKCITNLLYLYHAYIILNDTNDH